MNTNKSKISILVIVSIVALIIGGIYINYLSLDVYNMNQNENILTKDGVVYKMDEELTRSYLGGDLNGQKMIGRIKEKGFWGGRIFRLKGADAKNSIVLEGLMLQVVYTKENKN